jgi:drug/metabolite transporter (DMT)-like permease
LGTSDEKLSLAKGAGIASGILGVAVLVGPDVFHGASYVWGAVAVIGASCAYGFGGVYSRRFKDLPAMMAATEQVSGAAILLVPLSLGIDHPWTLPAQGLEVWISLAVIALVNTALAYFVYFKMLANVGVTYISLVTLLIPVIALLLGAVFLGETITTRALAGTAIIALGLLAIDGRLIRLPSMRRVR